ncbi:MAG: Segregation and condensation protein A [Methanonatronarchaeales archaeon]|nr:Segregation and condensation protein A [Methanonatronarchaeales archaeon]
MQLEAAESEGLADGPIDLLVSLAREGEIDPWRIDIVNVTDRFLGAVNAMDRRGLRDCGETLLYASTLLRMKSEAILQEDGEPVEAEEGWEPAPMNPLWNEPPELEPPVRREAPRPATLPELIGELKNAARRCELREIRLRDRDEEERRSRETVRNLPHSERLEERVAELTERLRGTLSSGNSVDWEDLLKSPDRSGRVSLLLPLLFLEDRGLVELRQSEIYGDLYVCPGGELFEPDEADD